MLECLLLNFTFPKSQGCVILLKTFGKIRPLPIYLPFNLSRYAYQRDYLMHQNLTSKRVKKKKKRRAYRKSGTLGPRDPGPETPGPLEWDP